jgi:hypothetical protein
VARALSALHEWASVRRYKRVVTETKNFDIVGIITDEHGEPKIILSKVLRRAE